MKASEAVGFHAASRPVELAGVERERVGGRLEDRGVGQHLAELDLAVAVEVRLDAPGRVLRPRAPEHALGQVEEVPGLAQDAPVRELQVERDGARRVFLRARARVEDHVVDGE